MSEHNINIGEYLVAILFIIVGMCIAIFTAAHTLGLDSNTRLLLGAISIGEFLFRSFHIGAYVIAFYFFIASALVFWEQNARSLFFDLTILSLPILTFSLGMRVLFHSAGDTSPIVAWTVDTFGLRVGVLMSFLATGAIMIIALQFRGKIVDAATPYRGEHLALEYQDRTTHDLASEHQHHNRNDYHYNNHQKHSQDQSKPHIQHNESNTEPVPSHKTERKVLPIQSTCSHEDKVAVSEYDSHAAHTANVHTHAPPDTTTKQQNNEDNTATSSSAHTSTTPSAMHPPATRIINTHVQNQTIDMQSQNSTSPPPFIKECIQHNANTRNEHVTNDIIASPAEFVFSNGAFYDATPSITSRNIKATPTENAVSFTSSPDTYQQSTEHTEQPNLTKDIESHSHSLEREWYLDPRALLSHYPQSNSAEINMHTKLTAEKLQVTLREFNIEAEVVGIRRGPVVTVYELLPARGVKLTRISALADNIALSLAAPRVRIVAPIPGKQAVGIELPNEQRQVVGFDTLVTHEYFQDADNKLPIALGKGVSGEAQIVDLSKTPHLLIAGATGSGKSVCVNAIISSLLFRCSPKNVRMLLVDPKIVELKLYNHIPHLITPVITTTKEALAALNYCLMEMESRYQLLDEMGARDIVGYNKAIAQQESSTTRRHMPYLVVVIDEFADLMITGGKQLEITVSRLAAMSRAVGIHLILATQRPSADVITGLIKANIPTRIAFMVSSKVDSRIILDVGGAEKLLGQGDMLFVSSWDPNPVRIQGALVTDEDVGRITAATKEYGPPEYISLEEQLRSQSSENEEVESDDLYEEALTIVRESGKASASYLQRRLQIGYNRAARIIEEMEDRGIIGPPNGSKARELLHT